MLDFHHLSYEIVQGAPASIRLVYTNQPKRRRGHSESENGMSWNAVYKLVKTIPRGRVTTYGALAKALRLKGGARAAGHAMAACPSGKGIPWHRVVGAGGRLLISEPHSSLQRRLLETEGVALTERRVNMKKFGWLPARARTKSKPRSKRPAKSRA